MRHERRCGVPSKQGLLLFLVLTCATTWLPAWLFQDLWRPRSPMLASGILQGSALYLGLIGWQPLIAVLLVRRFYEPPVGLNAGLRGASRRYAVLALLWPCAAMLLSSLFFMLLESAPTATALPTAPQLAPRQALLEVAAVSMACLMIYFQCWLEEIAWRGYFLVRAMECVFRCIRSAVPGASDQDSGHPIRIRSEATSTGAGQAAGWVSGWGFRPFWRRMDEPRRVST
jgi:hypothetical protein